MYSNKSSFLKRQVITEPEFDNLVKTNKIKIVEILGVQMIEYNEVDFPKKKSKK